jgi:hypothetical protein
MIRKMEEDEIEIFFKKYDLGQIHNREKKAGIWTKQQIYGND